MYRNLKIALLFLVLICFVQASFAEDWTTWRGPNRNGHVKGVKLPTKWPENLRKVWSIEVGEGLASPVVLKDRVYIFSRLNDQETISCFDKKSNLIWRKQYKAEFEHRPEAVRVGIGPMSTPSVSENKIVTLGISGILSCWSIENGKQLWQKNFHDEYTTTAPVYGAAMSPLIINDLCYAHIGTDNKGAFTAFEFKTGKVRWKWNGDGPGYTSPILAEIHGQKQIITQSNKNCISLDPVTGKLLWSIPFETNYFINIPTPVVIENLVIFSGYHKGIYGYEIEKSSNRFSAKEKWHKKEVSLYMSSPVLIGGKIYSFSQLKRGQFFCLNPDDGEILWSGPGREAENALLLAANDKVLSLTTRGDIVVFEANKKSYKELQRYNVAEAKVWAHLIFWGNQLLVKDKTGLTLWEIPK